MDNEQVKALIEAGLPGARVEMIGDACNMAVLVVSEAFEGKSLIQRHRMVMEGVKAHISSNELHALSIKAKTPAEVNAN